MHRHLRTIALLLLSMLAAPAWAEPAGLSVEIGWGNVYRAGRWNPIYITAESSPPREVVVHVEGMHDAPHAMVLRSRFALSPQASTHAVYFPLGEGYELKDTVLTLRDGLTGKRIASTKLNLTPPVQQAPLGTPMFGVSGDLATFGLLKDQFGDGATVGYLTSPYLPFVAAGYDALDVLMLNAPDLSKIEEGQQRAIVEWIRAGGTLLLWPGAYDTPDAGALIDVLPASIGENRLVELDPAVVETAGLTRIAKLRTRALTPVPDAASIPLLGPEIVAYQRSIGLGQIVIAPFDLATLRFTSNLAVPKFWAPLLAGVPDRTRDNQPHVLVTRWLRDTSAARSRTVPLWAIVGLVIVGPLDSLLLRLLGRRPWTVATVLGWAGLIAAITYNAREQNRERPIDFRSLRVIDEVDRAAAIVTDFVVVRPPASAPFALPEERGAWWQPAFDPTDPPGSPRSEFHAEQHEGGTWPTVVPVHVPTPPVLESHRWTASPSLIDASLSLKGTQISGKLTNRGDRPLRNVRIRTAGGVAMLNAAEVAPGATVEVNVTVDPNDHSLDMPEPEVLYLARRATDAPILLPDYPAVESSTFLRSTRIADLLSRGDRACVYAEIVEPAPPFALNPPVREKHVAFVRSAVRIEAHDNGRS